MLRMLNRKLVLSFLLPSLLLGQLACRGGGELQAPPGSRSTPQFKPGVNFFSPQQDVEMGRQSAEQIMRETPMLNDAPITNYVRALGAKLVAKTPGERFPYQFWVVATREINAFALPGGFLFVNAGTIAAARNEGELAGVMAHEIAHAALRHGTNQATKQQIAQMGLGVLGTIASASENPNLGQAVNAIGGLGANLAFLKYGRKAEKEADLEGARILAEAGYDPRDMANFFKTLESEGGQRVPEMLSDHPDPGNRIEYILAEIPKLPVSNSPVHTSPEFEQAKARLTGRGVQLSDRSQLKRIGADPGHLETSVRPARPAAQFQNVQAGDGSFALQVPANWEQLGGNDATYIFAPKGAYGKMPKQNGESLMVTHGIFVGAVPARQGDLASATRAFIQRQLEDNEDFQIVGEMKQTTVGGQSGLAAAVAGPSAINGVMEIDITYTTATADGRMFYIITIVPEDEAEAYKPAFQQILRSLRLAR
ncbi:MAG: M48 family metalloprotease [Acidobacteria bacterium]|nr:M48 family metalloprotease [Acidobacteriota bacterium]